MNNDELCPCKSGKPFGECCGPVLSGAAKAETAEALMRARYSSYVTGDVDFLRKSATKAVQADFDEAASKAWSDAADWHGLEIIATSPATTRASSSSVPSIPPTASSATTTRCPSLSESPASGSLPTVSLSARSRSSVKSRKSAATTLAPAAAERNTRSAAGSAPD